MARPKKNVMSASTAESKPVNTRARKSRAEILAEKRAKRGPVSDLRNSMAVDPALKEDGFEYRWVNDYPGRVKNFISRGWELVEDPEKMSAIGEDVESTENNTGTAITLHAGIDGSNSAYNAYLMRIEVELYEDDQKFKQAEVDKSDEALMRQEGTFGVENAYGGTAKVTNSGSGGYKP